MNHLEFCEAKRLLQKKQKEMAELVHRSQKTVSFMETGKSPIPEEVERILRHELQSRGLELRGVDSTTYQTSADFSWPSHVFEQLWKHSALKRCEAVHVHALIEPSKIPGRAHGQVTMEFRGLEMAARESHYLDHLADEHPTSRFEVEEVWANNLPHLTKPRESVAEGERSFVIDAPNGSRLCRVVEDLSVKRAARPMGRATSKQSVKAGERARNHAVAYRIEEVGRSKIESLSVQLLASNGVDLSKRDAIGFPLYADFPVRELSIAVEFRRLAPESSSESAPGTLVPRAMLIRRSAFKDLEDRPHFAPARIHQTKTGSAHELGPLLRLRGGYFYGLAWDRLKPKLDK